MSSNSCRLLTLPVCMLLAAPALLGQQKPARSPANPAPQLQGRFIDSDGTHLTLHYVRDSKPHAFVGSIQSTCFTEPASGESKALNLSAIPLGTEMTVYYLRRKIGKESQNVIMAIRIDRVQGSAPALPVGVYIPCFKRTPSPASK